MVKKFDIENALQYIPFDATVNPREVAELVEDIMTRKQVEAEYLDKIKRLPAPDNRYWIRINGRLIQKSSKEKVIQEIVRTQVVNRDFSISMVSDSFLEYRYKHVSGGTYRDDVYYLKNYILGSRIAKIPMRNIVLSDLDEWVDYCLTKKPEMKLKYFQGVKGTLSQIFDYVRYTGNDIPNIVQSYTPHRDKLANKAITKDSDTTFSDEELKGVMDLAYKDSELNHSGIPLGLVLISLTGLRDGELCGLHWRDVGDTFLHIQEAMVETSDRDGNFTGFALADHPKSQAGDRLIRKTPEVEKLFKIVKKLNALNGFPVTDDDFVFLRKVKDKVMCCTSRVFESRIKKYCKKLGMETLKSQHDLRRTFATRLYYMGVDEKDIQVLLGHEDLGTTHGYIKERSSDTIYQSLCELSFHHPEIVKQNETAKNEKEKAQIIDFSTIQALSRTRALEDSKH